jgi:hypothetical protein
MLCCVWMAERRRRKRCAWSRPIVCLGAGPIVPQALLPPRSYFDTSCFLFRRIQRGIVCLATRYHAVLIC